MPWNEPPHIIYADDDNVTTTCDEMTNGAKTYPYTVTSDCEKTLGEEADPLYGIFQVIFGLLYISFFVVFAYRFYLSMEVKDTYHRKLNGLSTFACGFLIMGVIDPNGYRDILPFQVYFISDEIAAATLLCAGILMIDSIVRLGNAIQQMKSASLCEGLSKALTYTTMSIMWLSYLGLQIIAMIETQDYMLWTSLKGIVGGGALCTVMVFVTINSKKILAACDKLPEEKVKALRSKFRRCERAGYGISFVLFATSALDLTAEDYQWKMGAGIDGWLFWVIFRIVMAVGLYVYYVTNKLPGGGKSGRNATTGHTTTTTTSPSSSEGRKVYPSQ